MTVLEFDTELQGGSCMETFDSADVAIVAETEMRRPDLPYWYEGEKEPTRLQRAIRWVSSGKVQALDAGYYEVKGSQGRVYTLKDTQCECEYAQHGKSRWCYHSVAVKLYQLVQAKHAPMVPPVITAPLSDTQETAMSIDPQELLPTETTVPPTALVPAATTTLAASALEASLDEWGKQRAVITRYIKQHFVEGTDYYTIRVGGRETAPTLGKPGAEKFLSLFQLQAAFRKDQDTWEMLGCPPGVLCYVCTLITRSGEVVGEGRGARELKQDKGDINKAIKMAQKSAQIDAILRTGALSDSFTQDLEDTSAEPPAPVVPVVSLREQIVALLRLDGFEGSTREDYERAVVDRTGLRLMPDNYGAIVQKLRTALEKEEVSA
jgi:hypothetical protein